MNASSKYDIRIVIDDKANATVHYNITLVNKGKQFFIRDYSVLTSHSDIINVSIKEQGKNVDFKKEHLEENVRLKIPLSEPLLSKGDKTSITLIYETKKLMKKEGLLWYLNVPPIKTEETLTNLKFTIVVPNDYGSVAYLSKGGIESKQKEHNKVFTYIRKNSQTEELLMFGTHQQFEFVYTYELDNTTDDETTYKITLPPDSNYQKSYFLHADPLPDHTFTDAEGNIIVEYIVKPSDQQSVRISGFSKYSILDNTQAVSSGMYSAYLKETRVWNYSHENIKAILAGLPVSSNSSYEKASSVYKYLLSKYDLASVMGKRKKVSHILQSKKELSCLGFSDSFVTLTRAIGVPSRLIVGYSPLLSDNQLLHFWTEFYYEDEGRWIVVDPCMRKTKQYKAFNSFDINRFTLAYWGLSDHYPEVIIPLTAYQESMPENLELNASSYDFTKDDEEVSIEMSAGSIDPFTNTLPLTLRVNNSSLNILRFNEISLNGKLIYLELFEQDTLYEESVFPSENRVIHVIFDQLKETPIERVENYHVLVRASYGDQEFSKDEVLVVSRPLTFSSIISWVIAAVLAFFSLFIMFFLRRRVRRGIFRIFSS